MLVGKGEVMTRNGGGEEDAQLPALGGWATPPACLKSQRHDAPDRNWNGVQEVSAGCCAGMASRVRLDEPLIWKGVGPAQAGGARPRNLCVLAPYLGDLAASKDSHFNRSPRSQLVSGAGGAV